MKTEHIARQLLSNNVILSAYFNKNKIEKILLEKRIVLKDKNILDSISYKMLITEKSDIITVSKSLSDNDIYIEMMDGLSLKEIWDNPTSYYFITEFINEFKNGSLKNPINLTNYTDTLNMYKSKNDFSRLYHFIKTLDNDEYRKKVKKENNLFNKIINKIIKSR